MAILILFVSNKIICHETVTMLAGLQQQSALQSSVALKSQPH